MDRIEILIEIELEVDPAAEGAPDQRRDLADDLGGIDELRLDGLLSCKSQQLLDELGTVLGRLACCLDLRILLGLFAQLLGRNGDAV